MPYNPRGCVAFLIYINMDKNIEKNELNVLLDRGFTIEIQHQEKTRARHWWQRVFGLKQYAMKTEKFTFKEPTLAVLDRVSLEYMELEQAADDIAKFGESVAKRVAYKQADTMARIIAIFALGENIFNPDFSENTDEFNRVSGIMAHAFTPSKMVQIVGVLSTLSNIPAFLNTIQLIGTTRTSNRIVK